MLQIINRLQSGLNHVALIAIALVVLACPGEKGASSTESAACNESNTTSTTSNIAAEQRMSEHFPDHQTIISRLTESGRVYVSGPALTAVSHGNTGIRFEAGPIGQSARLIRMVRSCPLANSGSCGNSYGCFLCGAWTEFDHGPISIDDNNVITAQTMDGLSVKGVKVIRFDGAFYLQTAQNDVSGNLFKEHLNNVPDRYF